ncbi:MAG: SGNH/GDSL hydrolase family protein [Candidatus Manganitrophus sp. SB1]|nr:SGNH/GDSL hydrolase family protein [Candidatus Manganitrophus morganii]
MKRFLNFCKNIALVTFPTMVGLLVLLELLARTALPVSDVPDTFFHPTLGNHFVPNQRGVITRGPGGVERSEYRINTSGWNSPYDYTTDKQDDVFRIAVIGDSYVEAFQVDYQRSFPYLAEAKLNAKADKPVFQTYSFGHSGANMAHYLHVFKEAIRYKPDMVIFNLVHNDLDEALYGYGRKDNWTLTKSGDQFVEVPPHPASNLNLKRAARNSALIRFMALNLELPAKVNLLKQLLYGDVRQYEANVDTNSALLSNDRLLNELLDHLLHEIQKLSVLHQIKVLVLIDGNRQAIYDNLDSKSTKTYQINRALLETCRTLSLQAVDLTDRFSEIWEKDHKKFNSETDYHWNQYGHEVVSDVVLEEILRQHPL